MDPEPLAREIKNLQNKIFAIKIRSSEPCHQNHFIRTLS